MNDNAETAGIQNLLQELKSEKYAADAKLVGIDTWAAELEVANNAFDAVNQERYDESAERSVLVLREVRQKIDTAYREMVARIEALFLLEETPESKDFITRLNVVIDRYKSLISHR
jgi:hypothetical protein